MGVSDEVVREADACSSAELSAVGYLGAFSVEGKEKVVGKVLIETVGSWLGLSPAMLRKRRSWTRHGNRHCRWTQEPDKSRSRQWSWYW